MQSRRFVEVRSPPEGWEQGGFSKSLTQFKGYPGHGGFIKVAQGLVAQADQSQQGSEDSEPDEADPGACHGVGPVRDMWR